MVIDSLTVALQQVVMLRRYISNLRAQRLGIMRENYTSVVIDESIERYKVELRFWECELKTQREKLRL